MLFYNNSATFLSPNKVLFPKFHRRCLKPLLENSSPSEAYETSSATDRRLKGDSDRFNPYKKLSDELMILFHYEFYTFVSAHDKTHFF